MKRSGKRMCSLLLALVLTLSLAVAPASALAADTPEIGACTLALDHSILSLAESGQSFTATLTVTPSKDTAKWTKAQWADWAEGLEWYLTRDAADSPQPKEVYPYVYTGDELSKWQTWGTDGTDGTPYFKLDKAAAALSGGKATVTLHFTTGTFYVDENGENHMQTPGLDPDPARNMHGSFFGDYDLSARIGDKELASTPFKVNIFESYTPYSQLRPQLEEIQKLAEAKGRYFEIVENGETEGGYVQYLAIVSDSKASVDAYKKMNETAVTDPAALQAKIEAGTMGEYRVPFFMNNVHPDECSAADTSLALLRDLATEDTLTYNTLTGMKNGAKVDKSLFDPKIAAFDRFSGLGSRKFSGSESNGNNDGKTDASKYYNISGDQKVKVDELLDNLIFVCCPVENPDGRSYNIRQNANGYDLNRDASNQTQAETTNMTRAIAEWNPVVFAEFHGYMAEFLVEPCTPPHEPNMEYDILVENFLLGAEAFGMAALGTMSKQYDFDMKFQSYYTPLRDDYDPATGWSAWDDLCTNYGPSYAMLNCGAMGYTFELPADNEASMRLFESGTIGMWDYVMQNKDGIYTKQLEFFRRGVENEDHRKDMEPWYVDQQNNTLDPNTWRKPFAETDNFFPEYWVIPTAAENQRDPADAYEMARFLVRNGVKVSQLTKDVAVNGKTYKVGDLVVDMYQAKRNYANAVLWTGADASNSGFADLYSESVANFPAMRGFTCDAITKKGAFDGALKDAATPAGATQFSGETGKAVVIANNGQEAVRAVNALLDAGKAVGMVTAGGFKGDFVTSYADFQSVSGRYVLVAAGVGVMPPAHQIAKPAVYLAGRYDPAQTAGTVTEGYYAQWFKDGYGLIDYMNRARNLTSNYDVMAYGKQLGFTIVDDPAKADVIVGNVALNQGQYGEAAVAAVKAGTPYIASGSTPLKFISENLVTDLAYESLGMEALHTVTYPTDSLTTASYAADQDFLTYTYNCAVLTKVPVGAKTLIQAAEKDAFVAGCCLNEDKTPIDGFVEAIALERDGMDLTIFANSVNNRAHQQDDYRYVTNTIYAKSLSAAPMAIPGVASPTVFTDVSGHWAEDSIYAAVNEGLFTGTSETTFSPATSMDRAMLVTVLYRMAGSPAAAAPAFADVPAGTWYTDAVGWAAKNGVASGTGAGFAPTAAVTREQLAVFLYNYAKAQGMDLNAGSKLGGYTDANDISAWAVTAMDWATGQGLISGKTGNRLDPSGTTSRAEVATILVRFLSK